MEQYYARIIRVCITGILLVFVFLETGWATTIMMVLIIITFELLSITIENILKILKIQRELNEN